MPEPAVETRDLRKTYVQPKREAGIAGSIKSLFKADKTEVEAVKGITLRLERGERVGFLGPNGAGKTTTLKMLSGILFPTSGEARVLGYEPWKRDQAMLRKMALVMGNKQQLWWDLPAMDSFQVLKEIYEVPADLYKKRLDRLIDELELADKVNTQVRRLSLGERMKCELVAALLHGPEVVFLDEPTLGLDVVSQKRIRDFLQEQQREDGTTLLLTSHYMQDVTELCDRVVTIDRGAIVFEGTLEQMAARFSDTRRVRLTLERPVSSEDLTRYGRVVQNEGLMVAIDVPRGETARATAALLEALPVA
ncbi:MAG: ATP-binding cassette domain-containing protein, partial [Proteobacteria bacterium]